jgi:membrane-associated phospholipid phosphatase
LFCKKTQNTLMRMKLKLMIAIITFIPAITYCQNTDTLTNKLDSLKKQSDTLGQVNRVERSLYDERTQLTFGVFGKLLLSDFKQQALSPLDINKRGWLKGAALVGATIGISYLDKPVQRGAASLRRRNQDLGDYSRIISDVGGIYQGATFAGIAAYGLIFKNPKLRTTTALATQSYITSTFWSTLFKQLSGRHRPHDIEAGSTLNESGFHGPFYEVPYGGNSAFPSGHSTLVFAAARVYAMEYKNIPAVPVIAYSIAGIMGVSRIIENKHWLTDVFAGALLGMACGTQVVNNYHRYARLVRTGGIKQKKKKGDLSLNVQYNPYSGGIMPAVVYKFR